MGLFGRLANLLTKRGRNDELLLNGMEHAKAGRPNQAIEIYDALVKSTSISDTVRARALFNRALAHSALKNDSQAIADLNELLALRHVPENVQNSARDQLKRVRKRSEKPAS